MMTKKFEPLALTLAVVLILQSLRLAYPGTSWADAGVTIDHTPPVCLAARQPYRVLAMLTSASEIDEVRLYFKTQAASSYYFVPMQPQTDRIYAGIIPAPVEAGMVMQYLMAAYRGESEIGRSQEFFTVTDSQTECPAAGQSEVELPIAVYAEEPAEKSADGKQDFADEYIEWRSISASDRVASLSVDAPKAAPPQTSAPENVSKTRAVPEQSAPSERSADDNSRGSVFGLSTKTVIGIGLGVGAAAAAGVMLLKQEEQSLPWTFDPQDVDKKIEVEIIKTPELQTTCGTVVSNALYVTNKLSQAFSVTSIDYEVMLTRERPSGGCNPGRIGTFAPDWAVIVAPGERALVRQWSNEVNPCSGCPYVEATCRWNSKYIVHTTLGSGEAKTEFASEGNLCAASASKNAAQCTPPNADVEP